MKVFVSGATGFIGRVLIARLIGKGDEVIALVRKKEHNLPEKVKVVYGDILSPHSWKDSGYGCQRVYHLASMISFDPGKREQLLLINGTGTFNLLSACVQWNIEAAVVVSSASTMGLSYNKDNLLDEESFANQEIVNSNPYLESKFIEEKIAASFFANYRVVMMNPTTVYGPGDWTLNSGTLIKTVLTSRILPVPPGGSNVVDVEDVVEGIILAGEYGHSGLRYIIGNENLTFKEIFTVISDVVKNKPFLLSFPSFMRPFLSWVGGAMGSFTGSRLITSQIVNDMFCFKYYSTKRAENHLGFKPRYSFRESVERAWSFYREHGLI